MNIHSPRSRILSVIFAWDPLCFPTSVRLNIVICFHHRHWHIFCFFCGFWVQQRCTAFATATTATMTTSITVIWTILPTSSSDFDWLMMWSISATGRSPYIIDCLFFINNLGSCSWIVEFRLERSRIFFGLWLSL